MQRRSPLRIYLWRTLFWVPLSALIMPWILMGRLDPMSHLLCLVIAEVIMTTITLGFLLARYLRCVWLKRQRLPFQESSVWIRILQSAIFMPIGTWLGLKAGQVVGGWFGVKWETIGWSEWKTSLIWGLVSAFGFWSYAIYTDMKSIHRELEKKHLEARLALITSRLNPHFLFNALNSLASLIGKSPPLAEEFTLSLSDYYRQILWAMEKEELSLAEELRLCQAYLTIEQVRFGQRLKYRLPDFETMDSDDIKLPALCLQPLIENALKHGILPCENGGMVEIQIERFPDSLQISVLDDGEGVSSLRARPGSGTALKNLRERLSLVYGSQASLELKPRLPQGVAAVLTLPYTRAAG